MEQNLKLRLLVSIGKVYEQSKGCKLDPTFFKKVDKELHLLSDYFKVSKNHSFIIAIVFALNYKGNTVDLKDLIEYFDCNPMKLLEYSDDFESLYSNGILKKRKSSHRLELSGGNDQFIIHEKITEAILNNKPMPVIERECFKDVIELLEKFYKLGDQRDNGDLSTSELFTQGKELISSHNHFPLIKKIIEFQLGIEDTYIYLYLIYKSILGNDSIDIGRVAEGIFDKALERVKYLQNMIYNENKLLTQNLIIIEEAMFFSDTEIKLSDTSKIILQEAGIKLFANKKKKSNIIEPLNIISKVLYFNKEEKSQLELLKRLLSDSELNKIQQRLAEKRLPKGIASLLYGLPGTGKTETVYQLAKETNREIIKVDISQSKSMWFGESEKKIKQIFTDYKEYAKDCDRTPILLFNEADAILSKRKDIGQSNTRQTENTMQNIILEELENFEGIFFATTNLVNNLDSAFERRFLFKIEFHKPIVSVKAKIWELKLTNMNPADYELLAKSFDFSGGQIENIVRKSEMHEVLNGVSVNINDIIGFCNAENLSKNNGIKIGFTKN
jgi:AAA+ superfamily predicted ATPase